MSDIQTIFNPEILISKLSAPINDEIPITNENRNGYDMFRYNYGIDQSIEFGLTGFIVIINGLTLQDEMIDYVDIDATGKYPKITMRVVPDKVEFFNFGFPKDGDLINIYYRSTFNELHPIRNDYIITNCYEESTSTSYIIHGVLHIKDMFYDTSFSYNGTSFKTAMEIAKKLKLGFSTNVTDTDDVQNWICASEPIDTFLDNIKKHAWLNNKSFFDVYIDNYYNLNFIDIRNQLTNEIQHKINLGLYKFREYLESNKFSKFKPSPEDFEYTHPVLLTNWMRNLLSENHIIDIKPINQSSRISLEEGYKKFLHFYDYTLDEKIELNNELIVSDSDMSEYSVLIGGYTDKDWKKNARHLWKGVLYSLPDHNVHPFYYKAEYHNEQNLKEIDKLTIEITLPQVNFNLYRYMVIPVLYYEYGSMARALWQRGDKFNSLEKDENLGLDVPYILNDFISGFYIIKGFKFSYIGGDKNSREYVQQKVILTRTEWPKSIIVPDETESVVTNHNK